MAELPVDGAAQWHEELALLRIPAPHVAHLSLGPRYDVAMYVLVHMYCLAKLHVSK